MRCDLHKTVAYGHVLRVGIRIEAESERNQINYRALDYFNYSTKQLFLNTF